MVSILRLIVDPLVSALKVTRAASSRGRRERVLVRRKKLSACGSKASTRTVWARESGLSWFSPALRGVKVGLGVYFASILA